MSETGGYRYTEKLLLLRVSITIKQEAKRSGGSFATKHLQQQSRVIRTAPGMYYFMQQLTSRNQYFIFKQKQRYWSQSWSINSLPNQQSLSKNVNWAEKTNSYRTNWNASPVTHLSFIDKTIPQIVHHTLRGGDCHYGRLFLSTIEVFTRERKEIFLNVKRPDTFKRSKWYFNKNSPNSM